MQIHCDCSKVIIDSWRKQSSVFDYYQWHYDATLKRAPNLCEKPCELLVLYGNMEHGFRLYLYVLHGSWCLYSNERFPRCSIVLCRESRISFRSLSFVLALCSPDLDLNDNITPIQNTWASSRFAFVIICARIFSLSSVAAGLMSASYNSWNEIIPRVLLQREEILILLIDHCRIVISKEVQKIFREEIPHVHHWPSQTLPWFHLKRKIWVRTMQSGTKMKAIGALLVP